MFLLEISGLPEFWMRTQMFLKFKEPIQSNKSDIAAMTSS